MSESAPETPAPDMERRAGGRRPYVTPFLRHLDIADDTKGKVFSPNEEETVYGPS